MAEDRITGPPLFDEVMDMKTRKGRSILYLLFNLVLYLVIGALFGAWLTFSARVRGSFGADFLSLIVLLVCTTRTLDGYTYLYPLFPFNKDALVSALFRKRLRQSK